MEFSLFKNKNCCVINFYYFITTFIGRKTSKEGNECYEVNGTVIAIIDKMLISFSFNI